MQLYKDNETKLKRKLKPDDYCPDTSCKVVTKDGQMFMIPSALFVTLRRELRKIKRSTS